MSDSGLAVIKNYLRSDVILETFTQLMGSHNARAYIQNALLEVSNNPSLQECTPRSIATSVMKAATMRLHVGGALGQAFLVPYKGICTFQLGYKGLHELAVRTGQYRYINVTDIVEGMIVTQDVVSGLHSVTGEATHGGATRGGKIIGWLAAFQMNNRYSKTLYMTIEEIHDHAKRYSKSYDDPKSLWKKNPRSMERKTPLRILLTQWGSFSVPVRDDDEIIEGEVEEMPEIADLPESVPMVIEEPKSELEIMSDLGFDEPEHEITPQERMSNLPSPDGKARQSNLGL
jgi:recombination protein RecT